MGKRYRLVKIYPRSVKLGTIIEFGIGCGDTEDWIKQYPKEASEFWEEIKEFKILSVIGQSSELEYKLQDNNKYVAIGVVKNYTYEEVINKSFLINSVERTSDNAQFKIGDKVHNPKLQKPMPFVITKFYFDCNNEQLLCDGECCGNGHINITKIEHYKEPTYKILKSCPIEGTIYSVERLSDGEIFTIGDICSPSAMNNPAQITKFEFVLGDQLRIQGMEGTKRYWYLDINTIAKVKIPLLITEDGKEIYSNDDFYHVDPYWSIGRGKIVNNAFASIVGYKHFSTRELAEKFVKENKPQFSIKDFKKFSKYLVPNTRIEEYLDNWLKINFGKDL